MALIVVYFTTPNKKEAVRIGKKLLNEKLAACINIFPVSSIYWWKDEICEDEEFAVLVKTSSKLFNRIVKRIKELHSYELPVIEKFDARTYSQVEKWIKKFTK